jgi:hypothetical protein
MNSNKVQAITGFIVTIIIIGVILAIYFSTRTKKSDTGTVEEKVPNISISGVNLAKKTETYMLMTEYYDLPELSKQVNIDVTVTISDSYLIETLKIKRTNGTNISEKNLDISDGTKTVSFEALTDENMASGHTIEVIYTTYLNTTEVIGASGTITISEEQLSLATVEGSGSITLTVNTGLQSDVRITKNYVVITLGTTDIFAGKKVYFAPVTGTSKGFKIMDTGSDVIIGKTFYIFDAGNKKVIGTEPSETASIEYITYTGGSISLSAKNVDFQNKLFDVSIGEGVEVVAQCANFVRIKSRYGYYLKDMGDGELRSDKRSDIPGIGEWKFEGSFPDDVRIKAPNGQYLVDLGDAFVRLEWQNWKPGVNGWKILGNDFTNLNIKSPTNKYLCMKSDGKIFLHGSQLPEANAWKIECY